MSFLESYLSKKEYAIMRIFWSNESRSFTSSDLVDELAEEERTTPQTLIPILNRMVDKGYLEIIGKELRSKSYAKVYSAKLTLDEYYFLQFNDIQSQNKSSPFNKLLSFFSGNNTIDIEDLKATEEFIKKLYSKSNRGNTDGKGSEYTSPQAENKLQD